MYIVHCTIYDVHCTSCNIQHTMYNVLYTIYTGLNTQDRTLIQKEYSMCTMYSVEVYIVHLHLQCMYTAQCTVCTGHTVH